MALDIDSLTDRWGKEFGSINVINTFRGVTIYARADAVNALFPGAADQRVVVDNLYDQTQESDQSISQLASVYTSIASRTLEQMCIDDTANLPSSNTTDAYLAKLVTDMLAAGDTFQLPTVTIGGAASIAGTPVNTITGAPSGTGLIIGCITNPNTGEPYYYSFPEILRAICSSDVASNGSTSFTVNGTVSRDVTDALWPAGSGSSITIDQLPTDLNFVPNANFQTWLTSNTDTPDNWTLTGFVPGTTIKRGTDPYIGTYNVLFDASALNDKLTQDITLVPNTNYLIGIRHKRIAVVTTGAVTLALTDSAGVALQDQLGNDLTLVINLAGAIETDYATSWKILSVPKSFAASPQVSIKVTTGFDGVAEVELADFILKPLTEIYTNGPQIVAIPGNIDSAIGDTYTFTVANTATVGTFVRCLDRQYGLRELRQSIPVAAIPTIADAKIS